MARYEVSIILSQNHQFAVEAPNPETAQGMALEQLGKRDAEHWDMQITVDQGVA